MTSQNAGSPPISESMKQAVWFIIGGFYALALIYGGMMLYHDTVISISGIEGTIWFWSGFSTLLLIVAYSSERLRKRS